MVEGEKFLIAAGTADYNELPEDLQLPSVTKDLAQVSAWFARHGYRRVLETLGDSPTADELRLGIADWFNDPARRPTDRVVFYYSGHGEVLESGEHYLLGRDSRYNQGGQLVTGRAYGDDEIAKAIASSPVQHVLVVFDTCFSAAGIYSFSQGAVTRLANQGWDNSLPHGIHIIAAAHASQVAEPSVFGNAFSEVLENRDGRLGGSAQRFLRPDSVCDAVNQYFRKHGISQSALYGLGTLISGFAVELLPNPRYDDRAVHIELQDHWLPKVRSGAAATTRWYFTGRQKALAELVDWLKDPAGGGRARVVTGSAGVGKSAVLAHLVTLADENERARLEEVGGMIGLSPCLLPPIGCFDIALHARGQTLDRIVARLGEALGCSGASAAGIVDALKTRITPFVIAIDALDEAFDLLRINSELLRRIASIKTVKLLVGLRSDGGAAGPGARVRGLGRDTIEIDLDASGYLEPGDVQTYVTRRLLAEEEPERATPYRGDRLRAEEVARAVAAQSGGVFLLARVISDTLVAEKTPRDTTRPGQMNFPSAIGDAFDELLSGFDRDGDVGRQRVADVLLPLAYAEGAGLPWESVWALAASALAAYSYLDDDIDVIFRRGTGLVVEATEGGRSVYRLYHQELADYLRKERNSRRDHASLMRALAGTVPLSTLGGPDWLRADPYITMHLAAHAAHADELALLISDALYVATADRQRLISVLAVAVSDDVVRAARAYRLGYHYLADSDPAIRLCYLELIARITGEAPASWTWDTAPAKPWRVAWANWRQERSHSTVVVKSELTPRRKYFSQRSGNLTQWSVTAVSSARLAGISVVISGTADGTLQLRRLADSVELVPEVMVHEDGVDQIVALEVEGQLVVLSTAGDGRLVRWDPMSGAPPRVLYEKAGWSLRGLSAARIQEQWIAAIGGGDRIVRLIDIETGQLCGWTGNSDDPSIYVTAIDEIDGKAVVAAGGSGGGVHCWRLDSELNKSQTSFQQETGSSIKALGFFSLDGVPCLAIVNDRGEAFLNLYTAGARRQYGTGHGISRSSGQLTAARFAKLEGQDILIASDFAGEVRVLNAASGWPALPSVLTDAGKVAAVALSGDSHPRLITGETDGRMRIWSTDEEIVEGTPHAIDHLRSLALGALDGKVAVAAGTEDGWLHILDVRGGQSLRPPWRAGKGSVSAIAFVYAGRQTQLATGGDAGNIVCWDLSTEFPSGIPIVSGSHSPAVESLTLKGFNAVAVQKYKGKIGFWDVDQRIEIGLRAPGHDHLAVRLRTVILDGRLVLVSSGSDEKIRFWDVESGTPFRPPINAKSHTYALAFAQWRERAVVLSGDYDGKVNVWDALTGRALAQPIAAHGMAINTIAVGTLGEEVIGVSGGADAQLVVWRPSGEVLRRIDLGSGAWIYGILPLGGDSILVGTAKGLVRIGLSGFDFPLPDRCADRIWC